MQQELIKNNDCQVFECDTLFGKFKVGITKTQDDHIVIHLESAIFAKDFTFNKHGLIIRIQEILEWLKL